MTLALELGSIKDPAVQRALQVIAQQFPVAATGGGGGAETDPIASPALATHAALTTGAHGGIVASTDPRLTDARTPSGTIAGDLAGSTWPTLNIAAGAIVNADVNAAAAIARSKLDFGSGLVNADIAAAAAIAKTKLASLDVVNADVNAAAAIAESKLNLATDAAAGTGSRRTLGTGALQAAAGNDARLSDARTPTAHHTTHEPGGTDAMAVDAAAATGSLRTLGTTTTSAAAGNRGMPTGGTTNQVLAKNSATNYDASWLTVTGGTPMRFGQVSSTGTIVAGTGFTVSKTGTGVYVVTTAGFTITSAIVNANAGGNQVAGANTFTTNTFTVKIFQATTSAAIDSAFTFIAV